MRVSELVGLVMWCVFLAGCGGGEPVTDDDAGVLRGPEGGVLRFDAAMIVADAGPPPPDVSIVRPDAPVRDTGARRCSGVARSCASFGTSSLCSSQDGCRRDGQCEGFSTSCYSLFSSLSCNSQEGCYWSSLDDACRGSAWSCNLMRSSSECSSQRGCSWRDTCEGFATSCAARSEGLCLLQEGCYLE